MVVITHCAALASHSVHAPVIARAAVPIVPILLLPFILVFFVVVFPIWLVSVGVLGAVLLLTRGLASLVHRVKPGAMDGALATITRAHRWVWTWGGLAKKKT